MAAIDELKKTLSEITSRLAEIERESVLLRTRRDAFTTVIQTYDPEFHPTPKRAPTAGWRTKERKAVQQVNQLLAGRNKRHLVLDIMRTADRPMGSGEVAETFMKTEKIEGEDGLAGALASSFSAALDALEKQGLVLKAGTIDGRRHLWEINRNR